MKFANTPKLPYYAVIFTSIKEVNDDEYENMSKEILSILKNQEGFLGFESVRNEIGITIS
jgi:heme-degrading monooxygenase HmoA